MAKFQPGQSGNPKGKPLGTKHKFSKLKALSVAETLDAAECNPFQILAELAMNGRSEKVRCEAASELCQYIEPKLKSIEHKGDKENPLKVYLNFGTP